MTQNMGCRTGFIFSVGITNMVLLVKDHMFFEATFDDSAF